MAKSRHLPFGYSLINGDFVPHPAESVLQLNTLKQQYQKPEFQLFIPDGGFGCSPTASGRRVYGTFLWDGDRGSFYRQDFIGLLKPEHLPDWGREKLEEIQQETETPEQGQTMNQ